MEFLRVALLGKPVNNRPAGIAQPHHLGTFVKSLTNCIVDCLPENLVLQGAVSPHNLGVSSGHQKAKVREGRTAVFTALLLDEIRKYIRFEDGNILLGNSSSPLILRIRNDRIQFLQNGYEVAYISDQRMYNTTCEIINQLRIADSAWTVETNRNGDTIVSLIGL